MDDWLPLRGRWLRYLIVGGVLLACFGPFAFCVAVCLH